MVIFIPLTFEALFGPINLKGVVLFKNVVIARPKYRETKASDLIPLSKPLVL